MRTEGATGPDGQLLIRLLDDAGEFISEQPVDALQQPASARALTAAIAAMELWEHAENARVFHLAQGQSYWDARAPGAGLPTGAAAYNTATTFITARRDAAWERVLAALNRWRLA